jgi:hypothetical protein
VGAVGVIIGVFVVVVLVVVVCSTALEANKHKQA